VLDDVLGIDSTRFQKVSNHLDTKKDQRRAAPEYRFSWRSKACSVGDLRSACVEQYGRRLGSSHVKAKAHLIAMLHGQLSGARSLREIETNLKSHAGKLYHLGGCTISKSTLSSANASASCGRLYGLAFGPEWLSCRLVIDAKSAIASV